MRLVCLLLLLASLAVSTSGCLAVAVGAGAAGAVAYVSGDLDTDEPYSIGETYAAAREAMDELGLKVIDGETGRDSLSARIVARDSADKRITIKLKAITANATKLSIRVGTFGNDTKTSLIYRTIRENLNGVASEPPEPSQQTQSTSLQPSNTANPSESSEPANTEQG